MIRAQFRRITPLFAVSLMLAVLLGIVATAAVRAGQPQDAHIEISLMLEGTVNPADGFLIIRYAQNPVSTEAVCGPPEMEVQFGPLPECSTTTYHIAFDTSSVQPDGDRTELTYGIRRFIGTTGVATSELEKTVTLNPGTLNLSLTYQYPGAGQGSLPDTAARSGDHDFLVLIGILTMLGAFVVSRRLRTSRAAP